MLKIWKKKAASFRLDAAAYRLAAPTRDPVSLVAEPKKKGKHAESADPDRTKLPVLLVRANFRVKLSRLTFTIRFLA